MSKEKILTILAIFAMLIAVYFVDNFISKLFGESITRLFFEAIIAVLAIYLIFRKKKKI